VTHSEVPRGVVIVVHSVAVAANWGTSSDGELGIRVATVVPIRGISFVCTGDIRTAVVPTPSHSCHCQSCCGVACVRCMILGRWFGWCLHEQSSRQSCGSTHEIRSATRSGVACARLQAMLPATEVAGDVAPRRGLQDFAKRPCDRRMHNKQHTITLDPHPHSNIQRDSKALVISRHR
jgi:hypothetical protein